MNIGVDVDGFLTDLGKFQLENGKNFFKDDKHYVNEYAYSFREMFNCTKEEADKFWFKNIRKYCLRCECTKGASELLNKLKEDGNKIYIITGRVHTTEKGFLGDVFRSMLSYWLKKNNIPYDEIIYCNDENSAEEKREICSRLNIDIMFEDQIENAIAISKVSDVILKDRPYNQGLNNNRVSRINEIDEIYGILKKKKESEVIKEMSIDTNYKVVRGVGVPIFKLYYHPKIINAEFIPKEGPIILCGNHLNVLDQFPVICATKRVTHWMAKKEYFEGKLGSFFKATGAICVDRYGDASKSKEEAINYLKKGSAVGIFPEGTRNIYRLVQLKIMALEKKIIQINNKESLRGSDCMNMVYYLQKQIEEELKKLELVKEQLAERGIQVVDNDILLPFKFGAVSMAKETGAQLVPFAVTGDFAFRSKNLTVRFGEPFAVTDDLEAANDRLRQDVKHLIYKNY